MFSGSDHNPNFLTPSSSTPGRHCPGWVAVKSGIFINMLIKPFSFYWVFFWVRDALDYLFPHKPIISGLGALCQGGKCSWSSIGGKMLSDLQWCINEAGPLQFNERERTVIQIFLMSNNVLNSLSLGVRFWSVYFSQW